MSIEKKIRIRKKRRALVVRNRLKRDTLLPRISVFRSLGQISGQIIDDTQGKTLVSFSSMSFKEEKGSKIDRATKAGQELAKLALEKGIKAVCFDRGRYLYHGRVKAFADGLRSGGITF